MGTLGAEALTAAACTAAVVTASAFGMPSGAGAVMLAVDAAVIITAVGNPVDYFHAAGNWEDIHVDLTQKLLDLSDAFAQFDKYWGGPAAESLQDYASSKLTPLLDQFTPLADGLRGAMNGMGTAQLSLIIGILTATISAAIALAASAPAIATPAAPVAIGIQWGVVGAWSALILAMVGGLIGYLTSLVGKAGDVNIAASELQARLFEDSSRREGNRITVPPAALPTLNEALQGGYEKKGE